MITKKRFLILSTFLVGMLVVALALTAGSAVAGSAGDGPTLTWPDNYESCKPSPDQVVLSGVPDGLEAKIDVYRFFPDNPSTLVAATGKVSPDDGTLALTVEYPPLSEWDVNPNTGDRSVTLGVFSAIFDEPLKKFSGKWTITCKEEKPTPTPTPTKDVTPTKTPTATATPTETPPPDGGEGCTPGYWRQGHHFDSWVGYSPDDDFDSVFGVASSFGPATLGEAVQLGGGGENALARHAVAALLNAANDDVSYAFTTGDVIGMVQGAYATGDFESVKDQFEAENEAGCPLD